MAIRCHVRRNWIVNLILQYDMPMAIRRNVVHQHRLELPRRVEPLPAPSVEFVAEKRDAWWPAVGYRGARDWDVALVGRNITDEIVVDGAINFLNLTAFVNEPGTGAANSVTTSATDSPARY